MACLPRDASLDVRSCARTRKKRHVSIGKRLQGGSALRNDRVPHDWKARVKKRVSSLRLDDQTTQSTDLFHFPSMITSFHPLLRRALSRSSKLRLIEFTIAEQTAGAAGVSANHASDRLQGRIGRTTWWSPARLSSEEHSGPRIVLFRRGLPTGIHGVSSRQAPPIPPSLAGGYRDDRSQDAYQAFASRARGIATSSSGKACAQKIVVTADTNSTTAGDTAATIFPTRTMCCLYVAVAGDIPERGPHASSKSC